MICRSLTLALLLTAVSGFVVGPQGSRSATLALEAAQRGENEDATLSPREVVQGLAVSALFGFAMVFSPLPSLADGKKAQLHFAHIP